jgi:selenocysteine-specific elongation factor
MIVGTAGHIDHGKTTLVRALTGIDTDRLPEEKARGISIELGYAYTPLATGDVLGFVDVPGHERLVHTMIAGACGIDLGMLVVAADDGVMPQTREHVAILELLGVTRWVIAITKVDRVTTDRAQTVEREVRTLLSNAVAIAPPAFLVDATNPADPGIAALRAHLHAAANGTSIRPADRLFRLAIDRVFTLPGHGLIVAGFVFAGRVSVGEQLVVLPSGSTVRVRSIHAQNQRAEVGSAGQRCALNIVGADASGLTRGDWLVDPRVCKPTTRVDVRLQLLSTNDCRLAAWSSVHAHLGAGHQLAHVVPLEDAQLRSGEMAFAQLVFETPVCALPGDRFIVRDAQAAHTIGGGVVLDPYAPSRRRRSPQRLEYLQALQRMVGGEGIAAVLKHARSGLTMTELVRLTGFAPEHMPLPEEAMSIDLPQDRLVILKARWDALCTRTVEALREFHARTPDEPGPDVGRLRRMTYPEMSPALWRKIADELASEGRVRRRGHWVHLPTHTVTLSTGDQTLLARLQPLIAAGRFDPPWVRSLATTVGAPEERVRDVLHKQALSGEVCEIVHDLFYDRGRVGELAILAASLAQTDGAVTAASFRDICGLGRKRAIQILEYFDRAGYTRRVSESHVLRADSGWDRTSDSSPTGSTRHRDLSAAEGERG